MGRCGLLQLRSDRFLAHRRGKVLGGDTWRSVPQCSRSILPDSCWNESLHHDSRWRRCIPSRNIAYLRIFPNIQFCFSLQSAARLFEQLGYFSFLGWIVCAQRDSDIRRRHRKIRPVSSSRVVARCNGWADICFCPHTRCDHGERWCISCGDSGPLYVAAFSTISEVYPFFLTVAAIGAFTAFLAATQAMVSDELKKVLAYSTVSQIGYMMLGLGVAGLSVTSNFDFGFTAGFFHLISQALFKAGLFMCAG